MAGYLTYFPAGHENALNCSHQMQARCNCPRARSRMRLENNLKLLQALPLGFGNETVDKQSAKKADAAVEEESPRHACETDQQRKAEG